MRIRSLTVADAPPVKLFAVEDLADVVVIAGPNGVGKSRLAQRIMAFLRAAVVQADVAGVIEATNKDEVVAWGRRALNLSDEGDMALLRTTLQATRRRHNLSSSVVNFESDRSIQNVQALAFSWETPDPYEEEIGWDYTWNPVKDRYQDTVHSLFKLIESQKQRIASRAIDLQRQGKRSMNLRFADPMDPFKDVFRRLLGPKELVSPSARQQRLEYTLDGETFDVPSSLSSGEREVVTIAFDFLLRRPQDCIVFFDEPELHLHPELSFRLIQTLQTIGSNNQFIFTTHSPDIIASALDKSVVFLGPANADSSGAPVNQAIAVSETDETNQALRLLGQSVGIIALGRRIVLIEGSEPSLDKQVYGFLVRELHPELVLVPSRGREALTSFETVRREVLDQSLWGVEFFMVCDRDSAPPDASPSSRLEVLSRYHLENYFLDERVWARVFEPMEEAGSWLRSPTQIRAEFRRLARGLISYAVALKVANEVRLRFGNVDLMPKACHEKTVDQLVELLRAKVGGEESRFGTALDAAAIEASARSTFARLETALDDDDDAWKLDVPGKPLVRSFASKAGIAPSRAQRLYLEASRKVTPSPFEEVIEIFGRIAAA